MQYLYLLKCQQFYKIGIANDVQSRLTQLSTGNPFDLDVLAVYGFSNASPVETAIHQRYSGVRQRGEWFSLDEHDLLDIEQICILLGGEKAYIGGLQEIKDVELEEVEELAECSELNKYDYKAMFAEGWRMEFANENGKHRNWMWRRGFGSNRQSIYGGVISSLPYPSLEDMRRVYRDNKDE